MGTMAMTDAEVGQYIRLLCFQHQHGPLDAVAMQRLCGGTAASVVLEKFEQDENGRYFNARLEAERQKRLQYSDKQRKNAEARWKVGNATAMPPHNSGTSQNDAKTMPSISNKYDIEEKKENNRKRGGAGGGKPKIDQGAILQAQAGWPDGELIEVFGGFLAERAAMRKPATPHSQMLLMRSLVRLSGGDWSLAKQIVEQSIERRYQGFFPLSNQNTAQKRNKGGQAQNFEYDQA